MIICDWLDVTFPADGCPYPDTNRLLLDAGFLVEPARDRSTYRYRPPKPHRGIVVIEHRSRWARISASGGACSYLRQIARWDDYLWCLAGGGTLPHTVTRLDAAFDASVDASYVLESLHARHGGLVNLGRKSIETSRILSVRDDGKVSGSWYAGYNSSAKATARVYDKSLQMLQKFGEVVPVTTRYEVTAWKGYGATLRDAGAPESIFWHIASPALLQAPEGVPMWQPNTEPGWKSEPPAFDPAALLKRRVESLAELDALLMVADELGPNGRSYLLHLMQRRLGVSAQEVKAS